MRPEDHQESCAGRVDADILDQQLAAFSEHGGRDQERRRRGVARDRQAERWNVGATGWLVY